MKKINNKSINFGLKVLTVLAFALIFIPINKVSAAYGSYTRYQTGTPIFTYDQPEEATNPEPSISSISPRSSNLGVGVKTVTITGGGFVPSSVARINGANRPTVFIDGSHLLIQVSGNDM